MYLVPSPPRGAARGTIHHLPAHVHRGRSLPAPVAGQQSPGAVDTHQVAAADAGAEVRIPAGKGQVRVCYVLILNSQSKH